MEEQAVEDCGWGRTDDDDDDHVHRTVRKRPAAAPSSHGHARRERESVESITLILHFLLGARAGAIRTKLGPHGRGRGTRGVSFCKKRQAKIDERRKVG